MRLKGYLFTKFIFTSFICAASAISLAGCSLFPKEEVFETTALVQEAEEPEFSMTTVKRGDICEFNKINCEYSESNMQEVVLDEWVSIEKVCVNEGDEVHEGDVLVKVAYDEEEQEISVEECRYKIKLKKEQIKKTKIMEKLELKKQKLIMDDETALRAIRERYDAERSGYNTELELLELELKEAKEIQDRYNIKAEMDGVVTYVNHNATEGFNHEWSFGRSRNRGNRIVAISDGSMPRFTASYSTLKKKTNIKDGDEITVVSGNEEYQTTVQTDGDSIYFMLDYTPEVVSGNVAYAKEIIAERKDVLYLPKSAINKMGDKDIVYCEDENGFKNPVEVEVGLIAESKAEIISGLEEGDAVIVR